MSGTRAGGLLAKAKNLAKDPEFYKRIGEIGGRNGKTGGFASDLVGKDGRTGFQRARVVGRKGGRISRRTKQVVLDVSID